MSCAKPAYRIIQERLAAWYLFQPRTFSFSLEQLAELYKGLDKQTRLGWGKGSKKEQVENLTNYLLGLGLPKV